MEPLADIAQKAFYDFGDALVDFLRKDIVQQTCAYMLRAIQERPVEPVATARA